MNTPSPPPAPTVNSQLQNQNTPLGSMTFSQGPNGIWQSNTSLNPNLQAGINNNLDAFASETPMDIQNAVKQGGQLAQNFMAPNFQQQQSALDSKLQNEGFSPTDQAYQLDQRNLTNAQNAYVGSQLPMFEQAALQNYMAPLQAATGGAGAFTNTLTPNQVQPAVGTQMQANEYNYGQQIANNSAMLGGLFSIPSAAAGGWAKNGFAMPSWLGTAATAAAL